MARQQHFPTTRARRACARAVLAKGAIMSNATTTPTTPVLFACTPKGAKYVGKATCSSGQSNANSWAAIQAALQAAGGQAEKATLQAAVPTHKNFVAYAIRRGWLAEVQVEAPAKPKARRSRKSA